MEWFGPNHLKHDRYGRYQAFAGRDRTLFFKA